MFCRNGLGRPCVKGDPREDYPRCGDCFCAVLAASYVSGVEMSVATFARVFGSGGALRTKETAASSSCHIAFAVWLRGVCRAWTLIVVRFLENGFLLRLTHRAFSVVFHPAVIWCLAYARNLFKFRGFPQKVCCLHRTLICYSALLVTCPNIEQSV